MKKLLAVLTLSVLSLFVLADETCLCKEAKDFKLPATDGKTYTQKTLFQKPTLVVFIKAECPHTPPAIKDFNRLRKDLGAKVALVGMIDLDLAKAKAFAKKHAVAFPLIADPKANAMVEIGARHSLDMALMCSKDQKIGNIYEGYSRSILGQVLKDLVAHGGPKLTINLTPYPEKKKSGCGL